MTVNRAAAEWVHDQQHTHYLAHTKLHRDSSEDEVEQPVKSAFEKVIAEVLALHSRKQADYGKDGDPFSNVRASEDFGIPGWQGCLMRANDKMRRLQTFCIKGTLANEGVEDSLLDLATYAVIALVLWREKD